MEQTISAGNKPSTALSLSIALTGAMLLIAWHSNTYGALLLAAPFCLAGYLLYFSIGTPTATQQVNAWCNGSLLRLLLFPLVLTALLLLYLVATGGKPWQGNGWQIPLLFCAPALLYRMAVGIKQAITWKDVLGAVLCILPYALHDYPFSSDLPIGGGGIEDYYLTLAIIVAVYSLVVVRQLQGVGFTVYFSVDALKTVMKAWGLVATLIMVIGIPGGLLQWVGYDPVTPALLISALALFLRTLFGTALPEELFFRGVFMNLLQQRLMQTGNWKRYLYGGLMLLPLAAMAGYSTDTKAHWFPLLCAATLWSMTYWLSRRDASKAALYTAMLIVSTLFGLAHFHTHSTLFMGLAMIAGWAYGHVYQRTHSVFYSALTHTLINISPGLFGLVIVR